MVKFQKLSVAVWGTHIIYIVIVVILKRTEQLQNGRGNAMLVSDSIYNVAVILFLQKEPIQTNSQLQHVQRTFDV